MIQTDKPILYVDDTEEQRYAMCRILEREGYRAIQAATGQAALAQLDPELLAIILDVKLPDMSGYEVCRRIKQHPVYGSIPVIQVSASFADPDRRAVGLSGGADAYIAQPVHPQELLNLVGSLVRSSHSERMLRLLAHMGPSITRSLDLQETVDAVCTSVVPHFADRCEVMLTGDAGNGAPALTPALRSVAEAAIARNSPYLASQQSADSVIGAPLRNAGQALGAILFVLETGKRRYAEADLVYAADIADRVALALDNARLYSAQRSAQEALIQSEKLAAAGRLSAAIAHELNNPLEAITNLLYLIETSSGLPEEVRGYAKEALSELERLSHITRQSLGFYRELSTARSFNLSENVEDTLHLYARRLAAKGITTGTHLHPDLAAFAIPGEIRQVVSNLIVNALDAMEQGGNLEIKTYESKRGEVVISVRDNGPGMPEEIQSRVFEPFFTTKPGTGTGLGLWVSETIVRKHHGRLELQSSQTGEARGTTMLVVLPPSGNKPAVNSAQCQG